MVYREEGDRARLVLAPLSGLEVGHVGDPDDAVIADLDSVGVTSTWRVTTHSSSDSDVGEAVRAGGEEEPAIRADVVDRGGEGLQELVEFIAGLFLSLELLTDGVHGARIVVDLRALISGFRRHTKATRIQFSSVCNSYF